METQSKNTHSNVVASVEAIVFSLASVSSASPDRITGGWWFEKCYCQTNDQNIMQLYVRYGLRMYQGLIEWDGQQTPS